ncbi:Alpha/Beta hydrolase protein [Mycena olivaceomarginata]|nr:Alpha/Beta hydrolase protein [Mycena olivaceomarginata]
MELWSVGTNALLHGFPKEFRDMLKKHELAGTTDSEEYQAGIQKFNEKHLCRVQPWPKDLVNAFEALEADATVYSTMYAFLQSNLLPLTESVFQDWSIRVQHHRHHEEWTVVEDIRKISVPTLLINGRYDDAQDVGVVPFFEKIPKVKWVQFAESSHMPFFEETHVFFQVVGDFLASN